MKTNLIIPVLLVAGVAYYIYQARDKEAHAKGAHSLKDDPNFQKGFAAGFITPGPGTWILLAGGGWYLYRNK